MLNYDIWNSPEKVGLISCEETQESRISAEEAESFYEIKQSESQNEVSYEMEAEDMVSSKCMIYLTQICIRVFNY